MADAVYFSRFWDQFAALDPQEREEVRRAIRYIESSPGADNIRTFDYPMPPIIMRLYNDGRWRTTYRVADAGHVEFYAVTRGSAR